MQLPPGFILRTFADPAIEIAPGVMAEIGAAYIELVGSREALLASGIVTSETLPGARRQRKREAKGKVGGREIYVSRDGAGLHVFVSFTPDEERARIGKTSRARILDRCVESFTTGLSRLGYCALVIRQKRAIVACFARWVERRLDVAEINETTVGVFLRHLGHCRVPVGNQRSSVSAGRRPARLP